MVGMNKTLVRTDMLYNIPLMVSANLISNNQLSMIQLPFFHDIAQLTFMRSNSVQLCENTKAWHRETIRQIVE